MLKQNGTLAKIASVGFLALCLDTQLAEGFTIISFDGDPAKWHKTSPIQVELDPDFGSYFDRSGCDGYGSCVNPQTAVQNSINSWTEVSGINLDVNNLTVRTISSTPHYDGKNQIKFYTNQWETLPFAPPSGALAVTITTYADNAEIVDSDIFINGKYFQWGVVDTPQEASVRDIQNVVTHELGHFFGLDHTSENSVEPDMNRYDATMFFASYAGETKRRTLENLDFYGIQHLYASNSMGEPGVDQISPNNVQVSYKGSITVEIDGNNFQNTTSVVLARNTDNGDIVGRVTAIEDSKLTVSFDVSDVQTGEYDVVVANSYNEFTRIEKGFSVQNSTVVGTYNNDDAGSSGGGGCHSNGSSSLLLFLLPLLLILPRRYQN